MRLVLLAGAYIGIAAGVPRGRPVPAAEPLGRLVAGVAPVLIVVGNRPAPIQVSPHGRIGVRQGLGADFADKRGAQSCQVPPVAVGPPVPAMQVLVTGTGECRT